MLSAFEAPRLCLRWTSRSLLAGALLGVSGCALRRAPEPPAPLAFSAEVHQILTTHYQSPEYFEALRRLEGLGPEVDAVLVELAGNPEVRPVVRANALTLLADRRSPAALTALRRVLLTEDVAMLRSAAVLALHRMVDESEAAEGLIRSALGDPARMVRLNALQALDIRDVEAIRSLLRVEGDPEVRRVAQQLVALAESRGAPLEVGPGGELRTTSTGSDPRLVYRPTRTDSIGGYSVGTVVVEVPQAREVPLATGVEAVARVVPAFFSPDRSQVVFEVGREIRVLNLVSREERTLGPGVAPRLIPFTQQFVFLREQPDGRSTTAQGTRIRYDVYRGSFAEATPPEPIGTLQAQARPEIHGNYSPVRWMVVGEMSERFALWGEGILNPFPLPTPVWGAASSSDASEGR